MEFDHLDSRPGKSWNFGPGPGKSWNVKSMNHVSEGYMFDLVAHACDKFPDSVHKLSPLL